MLWEGFELIIYKIKTHLITTQQNFIKCLLLPSILVTHVKCAPTLVLYKWF